MKTEASRAEFEAIVKVCERLERIAHELALPIRDRRTRLLDLVACHCNGCPLMLDELVNVAADRDFLHDVLGITRHMNRETGQLGDGFTPRFARPEESQT